MKAKIDVLLIIILALLTGCSGSANPSSDPTKANSPTSLSSPVVTEISPPNLTVAPEVTSLPPLLPNNTKEILSLFVRNNGGCNLPCLMGLTPGENYNSVESFGTYFINNTQQSDDQLNNIEVVGYLDNIGGGTLLVFWENRIRVQIGVGAYPTPEKERIEHVALSASVYEHFQDNNGRESARLLHQHSYYDNLLKGFSLPAVLTEYGEPTEIWIFPFPEDPGYSYNSSAYPFVFVLLYKDKGFAIEYIALVKEENKNLVGCPNVDYVQISTWDPKIKKNLSDIAQYFSGTDSLSRANIAAFKPLQDATSITVEEFHKIYQVGNANSCIQTPKQLWQ
jgi:hypothetical protein